MNTENTDVVSLVGEKRWSYMKIVDILISSASSKSLLDNMFTLARRLQIPAGEQKAMENRLSTNTATYNEILFEILEHWRCCKSKKASIFVLVRELEKCGLQDCAENLRKNMSQAERTQSYLLLSLDDITDCHSWSDLSNDLKTEISDKSIMIQGKHIKIGQLNQKLHSLMDGKFLRQIIQGEIPTVVNNQVPPKLEFYIQRRVESRSILNQKIFNDHEWEDVLVIQGLERYQLTSLVKNSPTDVSGNQIQKLSVQFIILELEGHFEKIVHLSKVPVHWIRYENKVYKWIKSSGSATMLQKCIDKDNQESFEETELAIAKNQTVVISDSPGIGKTQLLANIAHEIMKQEKEPTLVLFIVLHEFVPKVSGRLIDIDTVVSLIADLHSECEVGRKFLSQGLKSAPCVLLFDGFDEVLSNQIQTAKDVLKAVKSLEKARIYVTTRPHWRDELEQTMHALGYTIIPFSPSDQIKFLEKYWESNGITINEPINEFATYTIKTLTSKMKDSERSIAEIPLQCRMIAQAYIDDAEGCAKQGFANYNDSFKSVTSIFKLYQQHINKSFTKICDNEKILKRIFSRMMSKKNQYNAIKHEHMFLALKLLFPEHAEQFRQVLSSKTSAPLHDLCGLGILEATHENDIRFVHRTFAEYFAAWFAVETDVNEGTKRFILTKVLNIMPKGTISESSTVRLRAYDPDTLVQGFEFGFPVICHFMNGLVENTNEKTMQATNELPLPRLNYSGKLLPVYLAAAYHNYTYIPSFVSKLFTNKTRTEGNVSSTVDLIIEAAKYSGVKLLKIFCDHQNLVEMPNLFKSYSLDKKLMIEFTPLHVAIQRGHYNLVDYLINEYSNNLFQLTHLIHTCVDFSYYNKLATLEEKKQIIKLLSLKSKQWLDEPFSSTDCTTPLLRDRCSWELRECLILAGADINAINPENENVLHKIVSYPEDRESFNLITPESYHRVVTSLKNRGFKYFDKCDNNGHTPLFMAVARLNLLSETVQLFHSAGANFNQIDKTKESLLFIAIRAGHSADLISLLLNLGADCKHYSPKRNTVLHYSVWYGNYEAFEYFIKNREIDVNAKNKMGSTALHYAVLERHCNNELMQQSLVKAGANLRELNYRKQTPFRCAFENGDGLTLNTIRLMEEHGLNITEEDASDALKGFEKMLERNPVEETEFGDEILDLWRKSGREDSDFPWKFLRKNT